MHVSAANHAKDIGALMKRLLGKHKVEPSPVVGEDPIDELVWSFLLWDAPWSKAENALRRLHTAVVDVNELRVCLPSELTEILGERYPKVSERALRIRATLNDIFMREHEVSLARLKDMPKRDARKYLESLEGAPQFVTARVVLVGLGAHATPVDDRVLSRLIEDGVFEEGTAAEQAAALLERHVKATDGLEAHHAMLAWADSPSKGGRSKATRSAKKKTTKKASTTRSRAKRAAGDSGR